jgi:hypothetical protein
VKIYTSEDLHLFSFKMPALWAVMSEEGVADCASLMRNGVKDADTKSPKGGEGSAFEM